MLISVVPLDSQQTEYIPFSILYEIEFDRTILPWPKITEVTITSDNGEFSNSNSNALSITIDNENVTVLVDGELDDVFDRKMKYIKSNESFNSVSRWSDISSNFSTLYGYSGAVTNSITLTVDISTTQGKCSSMIIVRNNWEVANEQLREYVKKGQY